MTAVATVATTSTADDHEAPAQERRAGRLLAAPFVVLYALFVLGPVVLGLIFSFFNTTTVKGGLGDFVGLANYREALQDPKFWQSMWHSVEFTIFTTPLLVVLPFLAAYLVLRVGRATWFYRLCYFAPVVVPSSIAVMLFSWICLPEVGLLAKVLGWFGIAAPDFFGTTSGVWIAVTTLTVWWTFGFNFILYTAALQGVSREVYEAAAIDGAGPWHQLRSITLPLVAPVTGLVLILQILASLKVFDQIFLFSGGGPNQETRPVIEYIYDTGFTSYRGGYGAAATMVYFVVIVAVSALWFGLRAWRHKASSAPAGH